MKRLEIEEVINGYVFKEIEENEDFGEMCRKSVAVTKEDVSQLVLAALSK